MNDVVIYAQEDVGFYPTPPELVEKMLSGIDLDKINTILEPSAGKGDILRVIASKERMSYYGRRKFDIDCIEIDPNLRQILKHNFSDVRERGIKDRVDELQSKRKYNTESRKYEKLSEKDEAEILELEKEKEHFFDNGMSHPRKNGQKTRKKNGMNRSGFGADKQRILIPFIS